MRGEGRGGEGSEGVNKQQKNIEVKQRKLTFTNKYFRRLSYNQDRHSDGCWRQLEPSHRYRSN